MGVVRVRGLVALLVTLVALAGCNDPSPPQPTPTTSTPTTSSPTMSESTSPSPQPETAEQFIRRWVEMSNQMQNTGEVRSYLAVSRRCRACENVAKRIKTIYAAGGYVRTEGWTIVSIKNEGRVGHRRTFRVVVDSAPTEYVESSTGDVMHLAGGSGLVERLEIAKVRDSWRVTDLGEIPS